MLNISNLEKGFIEDKLTGRKIEIIAGQTTIDIPARSRVWLEINNY
jgi:hypothetical protein